MDSFDRLYNAERLLARYSQGQASTSGAYSETDSDIPDDAEIEFDEDLPRPPASAGTLHRVIATPLLAARAALPTTLAASPSASSVATTADSSQVDTVTSAEARGIAAPAQAFQPKAAGTNAALLPQYGALSSSSESRATAAQQPASPRNDLAALLHSQFTLGSSPEGVPADDAAVQQQLQEATAATESLFRMLSSPVQELLSAQASRLELEAAEEEQNAEDEGDGGEEEEMQHGFANVGLTDVKFTALQQKEQQPQCRPEVARTEHCSSLMDNTSDVPPHAPLDSQSARQGCSQARVDTIQRHSDSDAAGLAAASTVQPKSSDVPPARAALLALAPAMTAEAAVQAVCGVDVAVQTVVVEDRTAPTHAAVCRLHSGVLVQAEYEHDSRCCCCCAQQERRTAAVPGDGGKSLVLRSMAGNQPTLQPSKALTIARPEQEARAAVLQAGSTLHLLSRAVARHAESSMQRVELLARAQPWFWGRESLAAQAQENQQDRANLAELRRRLAGLDPR